VLSTRSASHSGGERFAELVRQINNRVSRHLGASRRALFEELERSALKPLSAEPYVFAEWKECRVGLDYHVEIEKHYHSVPHQLLREKVWARITARTIEVFHRGKRVAAHVRSSSNRKHTTVGPQWIHEITEPSEI
jgi:transposase